MFEIAKGSNTITTLASFNGTNGHHPHRRLVLDGQGNLYGTTDGGGADGDGTVFEIAAGSNTITTLASFNSTNGASRRRPGPGRPGQPLRHDHAGGANGDGTVFELTPLWIVTNLTTRGRALPRNVISQVDSDPIANGNDQITFASDISAGTIRSKSSPPRTRGQVTIIGPITLDGTSAGGDGLDISGNQDNVQNVTIKGSSGTGVSITGNDDSITGSQIASNQNGIVVSAGATGITIGGTVGGAGNVITRNTNDGIDMDSAEQTVIQGNWIGTDSSSTVGALATATTASRSLTSPRGNTIGGTIAWAAEM